MSRAAWALVAGCGAAPPLRAVDADPPALAHPDRVRFVAVGDTGKANDGQRAVAAGVRAACAAAGCDFVLLLGDNLYPTGMDHPTDPRADAWIGDPYAGGAPVWLVLGNHDWANRDADRAGWQLDWAQRRDGVEAPGHAWAFEAGPLAMVAVDTNAIFQFGAEPQASWARERLDRSGAPWKVLVGHHPMRSDGPHGNAGDYEGTAGLPWVAGRSVARFYAEAVCGRARLALSGHDHSRQVGSRCGTDWVVSGAGASVTAIVDRGNQPRFADAALGFAWIELRRDGTGELRFHAADGAVDATVPLPLR